MLSHYLVSGVVSFSISLLLTPFAIRTGAKVGLCDFPDNQGLKIHKSPIPLTGGLVISISTIGTILLSSVFPKTGGRLYGVVTGSFFLVLIGVIDDFKTVSPFVRILTHLLISILVIISGFKLTVFSMDIFNVAATLLLIMATINAVNLLDGMDGLATGVSAVCCLGFVGLGLLQNDLRIVSLASILLGALLGFLPYNFNPARIFLGDNGSTFIGFLLALLAIGSSDHPGSMLIRLSPILVLGLPLFDAAYAILRRLKERRSIFLGDRDHFYDKLRRRGFSQKETALIAYALSLAFTIGSLCLYRSLN